MDDLFKFLVQRWGEQFGYRRDKRGDCRQVVIALIVTPRLFR